MRLRMIEIERSIQGGGAGLVLFGGTAFEHDLETALQVEAERDLLVHGRARNAEHNHAPARYSLQNQV